ncbi:thioredoxin domain-containing protein [Egicoccus sp. AB-alg6-2]|uniref:thioredoxin domain-containing protein n=1 Tax=Egicoccus sp. AB-alg6-2 TaxID=3242692 RepID=UPI00359D4E07
MANRLAQETSPYLRQHADNPVDWYAWGDEAFAAAAERNVPIFLSVGYSSCHWCHVMAHESFEDDDIAAVLNERFVNVKVDREERPDVDAVYMSAVTAMTGHGGWPMSVFLTPEGRPFYAGTYWPKRPTHGMPSFPQVVEAIGEAWDERRSEVLESATSIATTLDRHRDTSLADAFDPTVVDDAARVVLDNAWDRQLGGFGRAPKFPQAMTIEWLLARHARTGDPDALAASVQALDAMARGGIHDQLAGGFARYSTDARWLVPHFEKMLYDNALLLAAYATAAAVTGSEDLARVAHSTAGYLLAELRTEGGAFVSATDADSEGVEGRYFVWSYDEVVEVVRGVDADPQVWTDYLGVTEGGNWEGTNVLHEPVPREQFASQRGIDPEEFADTWERVRLALLERRAGRVPPGVDDKVLTSWNAYAVRGLARAGRQLDEPGWIAAAAAAATFLHDHLVVPPVHGPDDPGGQLFHSWKDGSVGAPAFLEDVAGLALADLELFQATGEQVWFARALALARDAEERFHDDAESGWFQTAHDAESLFTRPKDSWDNATPAGTSVMVEVCRLLAGLTGDLHWRERAEEGLRLFQDGARRMPTGYGWLLRQAEALVGGPREVAIVGEPGPQRDALARTVNASADPGLVVVVADPRHGDEVPLLTGRGPVDGAPAAYVCRDLACERPVTTPDELAALLRA